MKRSAKKPTGAAFARPIVLLPIVLLVLALGGWLWSLQRAAAAVANERATLLQLVADATARVQPDANELSRLAADLTALPDHETAPDLMAAIARLELARQRPERAFAAFGVRAADPTASAAEQSLGAEILVRLHEAGSADAATATGWLRQAAALAERAWSANHEPADLLRLWQAATRLQDTAVVERAAQELQTAAADSLAARVVRLAGAFDPRQTTLADVDAVRAEFALPPPELDAIRVLLLLQSGDLRAAAAEAEALLARAPGVPAVRWAVALVFHACALGHPEGSGERAQWLRRRDPQLDWLLERAPADDKRRPQWSELRRQR
ncbi:MAG: hypothetical protein JNL08_01160 [Planctomycetes bacterium]|nr:hypothetical protein [Planctomycetota bacterium]